MNHLEQYMMAKQAWWPSRYFSAFGDPRLATMVNGPGAHAANFKQVKPLAPGKIPNMIMQAPLQAGPAARFSNPDAANADGKKLKDV